MKKITSLLMSLLLMFSLTVQAFAAGNNLNEAYLSLDEVNELLDHLEYPPGYDTVLRARVYYEDGGITTEGIFRTQGASPDVRPRDAAARLGQANLRRTVTEPYEQRSYYDIGLGSVVTERIYSNGNVSEQSTSDSPNTAAAGSIRDSEKWEPNRKKQVVEQH